MLKSEQLRKEYGQEIDKKTYKKGILTPNEIDEFLKIIEQQDEIEEDNSKRKIKSSVITSTETKDGKKFLTQIPTMEGNIPKQSEQERELDESIHMMDIFLVDAISMLKKDAEISNINIKDANGNEVLLTRKLEGMFEHVKGTIPFEIEIRNMILDQLKDLGTEENLYTVANDLLHNTEILKNSKQNVEKADEFIAKYFTSKEKQLIEEYRLSEQQVKIAIAHIPNILYNKMQTNKIKFYKQNRITHLEDYLKGNNTAIDELIDVLIVLKQNGVKLSNIRQTSKIKDLIENKENFDEIIKNLSKVSKDLNEEWPIGQRLRTQKKNNIQFIEEIKNAKIELTEKEKKVIFESENNQDRSERKTKEFVEILKILKSNGISLDIKMGNNPSKINDLLKEQPDAKKSKIITELKTVSEDIEGNWLIGVRLKTQRNNNIDKLEEEIKTLILDGTQFTESEIHILFDKRKDNIKDTLRSDEIIILMKKIVSKQKQQELLKENKEVNDEFTRTIKFTEHNLKYDEIEK